MKPKNENPRSGIFERSAAYLSKITAGAPDKSELLHTLAERNQTIAELQRTIEDLKPAAAEVAELKETVAALSSHAQTLSVATVDQVAALGFEAANLPGVIPDDAGNPTSKADFMAQHAALSQKSAKEAGAFFACHARKFGYA